MAVISRRDNPESDRNRVLVDLPERLRKSNQALRELETLVGELRLLYAQRLILKDSVVLDQIGDRLDAPPLPGDKHGR